MAEKLPTYGGQAVIEGVMMRGSQGVAIAMRAPAGNIVIHEEELPPIYRSRMTKIPFLRGLVILWDALSLGIRSLTIAANTQTGENEKIEGPQLYLTLFIALALGVGLFFLVPALIGYFVETHGTAWWGNLVEGILRLGLLIGYIWLIARMDEIKRVFSYHGAEHKTINAFEGGADLLPENVAKFSVEHPRCGTSFLLTLVVLSILFFSLLGPLPLGLRLASRILMLPILASVAYEYIRWTAGHLNSRFVRLLIKPNLALQHLTTREPSLEMLEVAIAAFQAVRQREGV
jgi:uncharacterized protein YqhQ